MVVSVNSLSTTNAKQVPNQGASLEFHWPKPDSFARTGESAVHLKGQPCSFKNRILSLKRKKKKTLRHAQQKNGEHAERRAVYKPGRVNAVAKQVVKLLQETTYNRQKSLPRLGSCGFC